MARGVIPDILKIGKITPVYKKDDKEMFENNTVLLLHSQSLVKFFMKDCLVFYYHSQPIWISKRSLNWQCNKLFYKSHSRSTKRKTACSRNIY